MATSINSTSDESTQTTIKKSPKPSKDRVYDPDWIKKTNANQFLIEEKRLLDGERRPLKKPVTDQVSQKRLSKFNGFVNRLTPEQVEQELIKRQLSTKFGEIEIQRLRLKHHYKAELTYGPGNPLQMIEQHFEFIAVIDFEATCEHGQRDNFQHEIIEFPIVLIDVQRQTIVDKFQSYCRPIHRPTLSAFCTELTGIEQHQVDAAPVFAEVLSSAESWLNARYLLSSTNKRRCAFATDGPWDFAKFLRLQCHLSSLPYPRWARKWINIRKEFASFYSLQRCSIPSMLRKVGLDFDGRRHSGLDDSVNIARIGLELIKDGCVLLLNDGVRAADPRFAAVTSLTGDLPNGDDEKETNIDDAQIGLRS